MRENNGKNTAGPNEFTDFKQFGLEHPDFIKTIVATNWTNHPGDGITLLANTSWLVRVLRGLRIFGKDIPPALVPT